uniref:Uncharacterized protein n=1 Tax=Rhizophora mucronata TaxID=61149 RepID=A0A2P2Q7T7_RHIMU
MSITAMMFLSVISLT